MNMFCVECGKEGKTVDGLCTDCLISRRRFTRLPGTIDIQLCGECFAVLIGKRWVDSLDLEQAVRRSLENALELDRNASESKLSLMLEERDPRNYLCGVDVEFRFSDVILTEHHDVEIRLKKDTCKRCGKKAGHYYEAIIQIRGSGRRTGVAAIERARDLAKSRMDELGRDSSSVFISKEERQHGGYDLFISSSSAARAISRELSKLFGAESKSSSSLVGMRDGETLKRMTYLVRLPDFEEGDVLMIQDRPYLVKSLSEKDINIVDLTDWKESSIKKGRMPPFELLPREEHVREATVVTQDIGELQVLDPDTMEAIALRKPVEIDIVGTTVKVVKTKSGLFLLP